MPPFSPSSRFSTTPDTGFHSTSRSSPTMQSAPHIEVPQINRSRSLKSPDSVISVRSCSLTAFLLLAALALPAAAPAAEPALAGYSDFAALSKQLEALAKPDLCQITSLAKSPGGREIWLVTIGRGDFVTAIGVGQVIKGRLSVTRRPIVPRTARPQSGLPVSPPQVGTRASSRCNLARRPRLTSRGMFAEQDPPSTTPKIF